jgi:hypothetical protein
MVNLEIPGKVAVRGPVFMAHLLHIHGNPWYCRKSKRVFQTVNGSFIDRSEIFSEARVLFFILRKIPGTHFC